MIDGAHVVDRYIAVWNETDSDDRRALIERTWSSNASYVDPLFAAEGPAGIDAMVAGFQQSFPGHRFRLSSPVEQHHDRLRFAWELVAPSAGSAIVKGTDFGVVAPDGRLSAITGFFDQIPDGLVAG
jgi:hypothetical protein